MTRLDARIETIELRLRNIILEALGNNASLLPSQVALKVRDRAIAAARKHPGASSRDPNTLAGQLEYFDLREIQEVITAKLLWPQFEATFGTKENLNARVGQLAELRNAIRHSRIVTQVTIKDGEAAMLWFSNVFAAEPPAPE